MTQFSSYEKNIDSVQMVIPHIWRTVERVILPKK